MHPVRRAELAFHLLGRSEEFVQYYESNRFGEVVTATATSGDGGSSNKDDSKASGDKRSPLSSLTGDDVSVGTDRIFFAKTLPHLAASVVGFCAVEAALELGNFADEDDDPDKARKISFQSPGASGGGGVGGIGTSSSATRFRESSERYERSLISELGSMVRGRAGRASQAELVRCSAL